VLIAAPHHRMNVCVDSTHYGRMQQNERTSDIKLCKLRSGGLHRSYLDDGHLVGGEGSCLVGANDCGQARGKKRTNSSERVTVSKLRL